MFGNKLDRDTAYEFALGKKVTSSIGEDVQLRRPHDFIVVADHAESIGLQQAIDRSDEGLIGDEFGKRLHDLVKDGKGTTLGQPYVKDATVELKVMDHRRGPKVIVYKMRPKKKTRRKNGHRQELTRVMVQSIKVGGKAIG